MKAFKYIHSTNIRCSLYVKYFSGLRYRSNDTSNWIRYWYIDRRKGLLSSGSFHSGREDRHSQIINANASKQGSVLELFHAVLEGGEMQDVCQKTLKITFSRSTGAIQPYKTYRLYFASHIDILTRHLFIWNDWTFTACMASSKSFSCSSWGDCCVVGWKIKKYSQLMSH